jgi:hypothetical protein
MSNGWKASRVTQVFGVQLRNKILREQFRFPFLLTVVCFYTDFYIYFLSYWHFYVCVSDGAERLPPLLPRR